MSVPTNLITSICGRLGPCCILIALLFALSACRDSDDTANIPTAPHEDIYGLADINLACDGECPPHIPVYDLPNKRNGDFIKAKKPRTWPNNNILEDGTAGIVIYGRMGDWYQIRFWDIRATIPVKYIRNFYPYPSINSLIEFQNSSDFYSEPNENSETVAFSDVLRKESYVNFLFKVLDKREINGEWWIKVNAYGQDSDCSRISHTGWIKALDNDGHPAKFIRRSC